jgi:hypothetical protein
MSPHDRTEFDFSLEEAVALQIGFVRATREGRSWPRREQRSFILALIAVAAVLVLLEMPAGHPMLLLASIVAITLLAFLLAVPFGRYYDRVVRTRTGRLLAEGMGPGPHHCVIEIHHDALRVACFLQRSLGSPAPTARHGGMMRLCAVSAAPGKPLLVLFALLAVYIVLGILYESLIHSITILSAAGRRIW